MSAQQRIRKLFKQRGVLFFMCTAAAAKEVSSYASGRYEYGFLSYQEIGQWPLFLFFVFQCCVHMQMRQVIMNVSEMLLFICRKEVMQQPLVIYAIKSCNAVRD
jgi:hypothetical protein